MFESKMKQHEDTLSNLLFSFITLKKELAYQNVRVKSLSDEAYDLEKEIHELREMKKDASPASLQPPLPQL